MSGVASVHSEVQRGQKNMTKRTPGWSSYWIGLPTAPHFGQRIALDSITFFPSRYSSMIRAQWALVLEADLRRFLLLECCRTTFFTATRAYHVKEHPVGLTSDDRAVAPAGISAVASSRSRQIPTKS
jgi:hypothetical protein